MGSKGRSTQTYTPNAAVGAAGQQTLSMGMQAANQPFQQPAQPVAGFNPDQQSAFQNVRDTQGFAQPYFDMGTDYMTRSAAPVTGAETENYLNPYSKFVMGNLNEQFGQQQRDITGKLTNTAGGVGADRIAVGQSELARQQGLAGGQTMAGIYQQALQAAQADKMRQANAGFGFSMMGPAAQGAKLQGAGALLGTGGQQQQLEQAKLMSPFQQELARIAYPFRTSQFLSGITAQQAPGQGWTTVSQAPAPSIWSQILGAGTTAASIYGGMGGKGSSGYNPYGAITGATGAGASGATFSEGGNVHPYDMYQGYEEGGYVSPHNFPLLKQPVYRQYGNDQSIPFLERPVLSEDDPTYHAMKSGWPGYAQGHNNADPRNISYQRSYQEGGNVEEQPFPNLMDPTSQPNLGQYPFLAQNMPSIVPQLAAQRAQAPQPTQIPPQGATPPVAPPQAQGAEYGSSPYPMTPQSNIEVSPEGNRAQQFAKSPWLGLTAAGLGIMGGTSPYAGVNIGKGGLEGVKVLEQQRTQEGRERQVDLTAKRLLQQAEQYRATLAETSRHHKATELHSSQMLRKLELQALQPMKIGVHPVTGNDIYGIRDPKTGSLIPIDPMTGKPTDPSSVAAGASPISNIDPKTGRDEGALEGIDPGLANQVKAYVEGRMAPATNPRNKSQMQLIKRLAAAYEPNFDETFYKSRNETRAAFSKGPEARMVAQLGMFTGHLSDLIDASLPLSSNPDSGLADTNYPIINAIKNKLSKETGGTGPARYHTAQVALADEAARLFQVVGVSSEQEKERWLGVFDQNKSPKQRQEGLEVLYNLAVTRMGQLAAQKNTGMKYGPGDPRTINPEDLFVDPGVKEKLEKVKKYVGHSSSAPAATAPKQPVRVNSPEEARKLPKGTPIILPDGRTGMVQ